MNQVLPLASAVLSIRRRSRLSWTDFLGIETYNNNIGRSAMPLFTDSWMVAGLKLRSLPALVFDGLRERSSR